MAADLTGFDKALRDAVLGLLEDRYGKPYPGTGRVIELTPGQKRENAEWRRRVELARERLADIQRDYAASIDGLIAEFDVEVSSSDDGEYEVNDYSSPHQPRYVPDDQDAYDQWRRDYPGDWGRLLFALERK
jgi:hypothetical protein